MQDPFLQHRHEQGDEHARKTPDDDPMASLVTVELNVIDGCNRTCPFCPHGDPDNYPNRLDWKMSVETVETLARQLAAFDYQGRISMSGYGEPLLNKEMETLIRTIRQYLPDNTIESNVNGDALRVRRIQSLFEAGITYLYVNCYDGPEQLDYFTDMFANADIDPQYYRLRSRWYSPGDGYAIVMNNRGGALNRPELGHAPLEEPLAKPCWYPFFKAFIDWDGSLLYCSNDWHRNLRIGNIHDHTLQEMWMGETMKAVRERLLRGDRSKWSCQACDVTGTLHSRRSAEILRDYYDWDIPV